MAVWGPNGLARYHFGKIEFTYMDPTGWIFGMTWETTYITGTELCSL